MIQIQRRLLKRAATCVALLGPTVIAACAAPDQGESMEDPAGQKLGHVELALMVGDAIELQTVDYQIEGNGIVRSGTANVRRSGVLSFRIGGLPRGEGYVVTLTAVDGNDEGILCEGSSRFDIVAGETTQTTVGLDCRLPRRRGSVRVTGEFNVCPLIDDVSVLPDSVEVGATAELFSVASDLDEQPSALVHTWSSNGGEIANPNDAATTLLCTEPGVVTVTLSVSDGDCEDALTTTVTCTEPGEEEEEVVIRINEVESSGGSPGDWAELVNFGVGSVDLSGWAFKDNDDSRTFTIAEGTILAPGAFLVLEEASFGFGLGGADSARLYDANGVLVDSYTWTSHAAQTYGRCPDGEGGFTATPSTKGAANACPLDPSVPEPWPGAAEVLEVDPAGAYPADLSGLHYQPTTETASAVLWGVINGEGRVHRLVQSGAQWLPTPGDWAVGKLVKYPDGTGRPDSEGLTKAELDLPGLYVSTERNNESNGVSRLSILRVDETAAATDLVASNEWNLTSLLPAVGANLGLEAITWMPDAQLVSLGFLDANLSKTYDPGDYPEHGTGLFVVGVEGTGNLHVVALDHVTNAVSVVATAASGHIGVMSLEYDRDNDFLWAGCDNTCGNETTVLEVVSGVLTVTARFLPPVGLPQSNNEGFAFAPEAECSGGVKNVFWSDDSNAFNHALRQGTIACGDFF